jgi:hypothetical protein
LNFFTLETSFLIFSKSETGELHWKGDGTLAWEIKKRAYIINVCGEPFLNLPLAKRVYMLDYSMKMALVQ